ncbi:divergent polysaccharide deacetylase family protein [Campylobacter corcagiensis]|uniref:Divergent polysaccharide deacetylase family protein n=1 Tax=Campylobacter corcagiensis TaxID=1448857 RepID=A0A7M1LFT5_9BACT|nr:divergent polysaccharide deacetylase family protein [Campylobacter corcagiensis]QKF64906.1 hypothetical protein CCORG_1055 [Campylobacter corcagiensis]QOQ86934.1 divergent polysaccharide deacetylase family protein [Campylobacter corcagiensis]
MADKDKKRVKSPASKTTKKSTKKEQNSSKNPKKNPLLQILSILFITLICVGVGIFTYKAFDSFFSKPTTKTELSKEHKKELKKESNKKIEIVVVDKNLTTDENKTAPSKKDENKTEISYEEIASNLEAFAPKKAVSGKPKLAIIIDDIATIDQAKNLKKVGLKLTPSIFPPDRANPDTLKVAKLFDFYMIHLPMEALNFNQRDVFTLKAKDSYENIDKRVAFVRENFKNAKFLNNHTGSKFTSDKDAIKKLLVALDKYGFIFVDSKTISSSKGSEVAKELGQRYIYRDIFIDNKDSEIYIKNQLKKAVDIAKSRGFAIAIGHPKTTTFKAIKSAKDSFLKDVEVVYIGEIYEYYK